MKKLRKEMVVILACGIMLGLGVRALLLLSRPDPVPPTIDLIEFRQPAGSTIAIFRATNHASQPFAYWGSSVSDPRAYFRITDRDQRKIHNPMRALADGQDSAKLEQVVRKREALLTQLLEAIQNRTKEGAATAEDVRAAENNLYVFRRDSLCLPS